MSRGGYTSAIDMWSMGCIFGELLQRIVHIGSAATPNLQIAPLFAMHGAPKTPASGCGFRAQGPGFRPRVEPLFAMHGAPKTPASGCGFRAQGSGLGLRAKA